MTRLALTALSPLILTGCDRIDSSAVAAKDHANAMVREHAVRRTLFKWRHTHSTYLNTLDLLSWD